MRRTALCMLLLAAIIASQAAPSPAKAPGPAPAKTADCNKDIYSTAVTENGRLIAKGEPIDYSGGTLTTYVVLNNDGGCNGPAAVGIELKGIDLASLPSPDEVTDPAPPQCKDDPYGPGCPPPYDSIQIDFPGAGQNASFNPFIWMGFNYDPIGHTPLGVYNSPHFDFHFFYVSESEAGLVAAGTPPDDCKGLSPESFYNGNMPIAKECFPVGYGNLQIIGTNASMGNHYIDLNEPVIKAYINGTPNAKLWVEPSWIVGGYNGNTTFLEPMVRVSYLQDAAKNASRICKTPLMPKQYAAAGYYPSQFCIDQSINDTILVEVAGFKEQAEAGCGGTDYALGSYITAVPPPPNAPPLPDYCEAPLPPGMPPMGGPSPSAAETPSSAPAPASSGASLAGALLAILIAALFA